MCVRPDTATHSSNGSISVIHFWQGETAEGDTILRPGKSYYYEQRGNIRLWAVSHSGTYVLLLVVAASSSDGKDYLGLLRFSTTPTPHTTFRKMDIGDEVERLGSVSWMALDDSRGTIFLLDQEDELVLRFTVLSFPVLLSDFKLKSSKTPGRITRYGGVTVQSLASKGGWAKIQPVH
ncbi:hypothetical protein B0H16DRAFT_1467552 [Mycena metata]|uniref:Uncharacterized protein n=1 Tax=Mycena metata TaxID=1033252 RepID=A0AAD7I5G6_9AGAR|nr:hypothetical protein B0H16DRAFT_1467552 [Mycena metata]